MTALWQTHLKPHAWLAFFALIVFATMRIPEALPPATAQTSGTAAAVFTGLIPRLAYALAPWSPLLPFALTRSQATSRFFATRMVIVSLTIVLLAIETYLGRVNGVLTSALLASSVACLLVDSEDNNRQPVSTPRPLLAIGIVAIGALLAHDLSVTPDRVLDVLAPSLPTGHSEVAARDLRVVIMITSAVAAIAMFFALAPMHRSFMILVTGATLSVFLRVHTFPALMTQVSPAHALDVWTDHKRDGDELGTLGAGVTARSKDNARPFRDAETALVWMDVEQSQQQRRFLALAQTELPRLNAAYRSKHHTNVPVLAGEGAFLLGVSTLTANETSENPLDRFVMNSPPAPLAHPLDGPVKLEGLDVLGWEITEAGANKPAPLGPNEKLPARKGAHLRIALRVTSKQPLSGFCTFVHIEHTPTRYNTEHKDYPTYPMNLWREGDVIIDDFTIDLPPHFSGGHSYVAYWGVGVLPCQDDHRMRVISGAQDGHDRVSLGRLEVK